jgi:hypothetical protein
MIGETKLFVAANSEVQPSRKRDDSAKTEIVCREFTNRTAADLNTVHFRTRRSGQTMAALCQTWFTAGNNVV